jgi:hypothetical protein
MSQNDMIIDNSTGANVRADINSALQAIATNNSGSSAPSTTYGLQSFANTTDSMLQLRNAANNAFVNLRKFDGSLPLPDGSASSPSLFLDDDTNTGLFSSAADTLNFTTGGVEKLELGATTIFNEDGADVDFRIEGDANANLFYLDAGNDRIIIGHSSSRAVGGNTSRLFEIESTDASSGLSIIRNSADDSPAIISLGKSRSASNGGTTVVQNGDLLGQIQFAGADGTDLVTQGAAINATVDGTAGSNDMPCRLTFLTTADGASSPTERFRIDSSGTIYVGGVGSGATAGTLFFNDTSANGSKIAQVNGSSALSFHTGSSQPEQMRIDSSGNIGIGTTSPNTLLHIQDAAISGYSPQSGTLLVAEDTGDTSIEIAAGHNNTASVFFGDTGASNKGQINYLHGTGGDAMSFFSNGSEGMRLDSSGRLLIGTTTESSSTGAGLVFFGNGAQILKATGSSDHDFLDFYRGTDGSLARVGNIRATGSSTAYNTSSDYRLKENVTAISDGITRLKTLKPSRFNFIADATKTVDGFLAHEVTAVPEAITGTKDEVDSDNKPVYQGIDQSKLVPLLVAAVQELITKVETLEAG